MTDPNFLRILVISDCDGVITDGKTSLSSDGIVTKTYGSHDREAIKIAKANGIQFKFFTASSLGIDLHRTRLSSVGEDVELADIDQRIAWLDKKLIESDIDVVYYVGDSVSDLKIKDFDHWEVTFCAPASAPARVIDAADVISSERGGEGALADIIYDILDNKI